MNPRQDQTTKHMLFCASRSDPIVRAHSLPNIFHHFTHKTNHCTSNIKKLQKAEQNTQFKQEKQNKTKQKNKKQFHSVWL